MFRLAFFASGSGTNVQNICEYFNNHKFIKPEVVFSDKEKAQVLQRANNLNIKSEYFNYSKTTPEDLFEKLKKNKVTHIILAGYLRLVPAEIIKSFNNKILNIHPSLLPKFGGKGFYGEYVHKSVIDSKEKESGITIHIVNEIYDEGRVLFQKSISVYDDDDINSLSSRIHDLEYKYYPQIIEKYLLNQL
jgi:phosphoribosylglycinamide formyltransferase-1